MLWSPLLYDKTCILLFMLIWRETTQKELGTMSANTLINKLLQHTERVEWQLTTFSTVLSTRFSSARPAVAPIATSATNKIDFSKWYDPAIRLPKGLLGHQVRQHLTEKGRCWLCRKIGHKSPECPKRNEPPAVKHRQDLLWGSASL